MIMKPTLNLGPTAFTRTELILVIFIVVLLLSLFDFGACNGDKSKAQRITCRNNLKEIGTAYRLWEDDHGGHTPAAESVSKGGWADLLTNADQGMNCWTNYAILADDLGRSPKRVMCPADDRTAAAEFLTNAMPNDLHSQYFQNNSNLSYFVGVSANTRSPSSLLAGDRNLGGGTVPDSDYGFSPKSGEGNDVAIPITGPISWSLKVHSAAKPAGAGNILMGDGSVQQVSSASLNKNWLRNATPTTNWPAGHVPATPSIRLIFP
jgi:prepilin-type processing-associated H-X9-DG protein